VLGYIVFSDTKASQRAVLGERVTAWLRANPGVEVLDTWMRQSSDREFHCQSIVLQYEDHGHVMVEVPRPAPQSFVRFPAGCTCSPAAGYVCGVCRGRVERRVRRRQGGGEDA